MTSRRPSRGGSKQRPRVLAALPALFPSTYIGVAKPLAGLHARGRIELEVKFEYLTREADIEWADVVVFSRNLNPRHSGILARAVESRKPIIYELDDNLLDIPEAVAGLEQYREAGFRAQLEEYLAQADLVRVYSRHLQKIVSPVCKETFLASGPVAWSLVPEDPPRSSSLVRIVYLSSRSSDYPGQGLEEPIRRVVSSFDHVEFTIWGPVLAGLGGLPRVRHLRAVHDYDRFFESFAGLGFDIGLAPVPEGVFFDCKSNNKFREYAAAGVAGIYADSVVYHDDVEDEVTGLLVGRSPEQWERAIRRLVEDRPLREAIQRNARTRARERFSEEKSEGEWFGNILQVFSKTVSERRPAATPENRDAVGKTRLRRAALGQARYYVARAAKWMSGSPERTLDRILSHYCGWRTLLRLRRRLRRMRR